jgi:hypothetical protein
MYFARIEQDTLGRRRLSRVYVSHDSDIAHLVEHDILLKIVPYHSGSGGFSQEEHCNQFLIPRAARKAVAKQPCNKNPPVGDSQSSISPQENQPGQLLIIRLSSSSQKRTPPALDIASSSGRGRKRITGTFLTRFDAKNGSASADARGPPPVADPGPERSAQAAPEIPSRFLKKLDRLSFPGPPSSRARIFSDDQSGRRSRKAVHRPFSAI